MKIETRLNIEDQIFFLHDKKVIHSTVREIKVLVKSAEDIEIVYLCSNEADNRIHLKVEEQHAFKSKAELLKSL